MLAMNSAAQARVASAGASAAACALTSWTPPRSEAVAIAPVY